MHRIVPRHILVVLYAIVASTGVALTGGVVGTVNGVHATEWKISRVKGPDDPGGAYKHPASITELENGDLYVSFYGGSGEYETDQKVWGTRLKKGTDQWSEPAVIADTPFLTDGNSLVWQAPDGKVWLFYLTRYGPTWSQSRVKAKISSDGAETWSDPINLTWELGTMVQGPPIELHSGEYLLPVYHETGDDREVVGADSTAFFLRIDPETGNWTESGRIRSPRGCIQANVVQISDEHLIAYCRRGGGYGPETEGYIVGSESHDGGKTWSEGIDTPFPNPNSAIALIKLKSGRLLLIYNDSMHRRTPLVAAISDDQGKTWPHRQVIADGNNSYAYPYAVQAKDGKIHLVFTSDGRSVINHVVLTEEDLVDDKEPTSLLVPPEDVQHVVVYHEPGRFGGWPANHGIWSWGDEILVGYSRGDYKDLGPDRHHFDRERPEQHWLARSLDGGESWQHEHPAEKGQLIPRGESLHGVETPGLTIPPLQDCPGEIDFLHPDFALTARMSSVHAGESRFEYSLDRGRIWHGPFRLPHFGATGTSARTDYLVNGSHELTLMLTAAKSNGREGRPLAARTTDGGRTWDFLAWLGPEPEGFAIMPATARLSENELYSVVRCREGSLRWNRAYRSLDNGLSWQFAGDPVTDLGEGNPPALIRLADGRLCLAYGYRAEPYRMGAKLSADGGRTWSPEYVLRDQGANRDMGYPRMVQRTDGKIVVIYYFNETTTGPERYIAATIWNPPAAD